MKNKFYLILVSLIVLSALSACGDRIENPLTDNQQKTSGINSIFIDIGDGLVTKEDAITPLSDIFTLVLTAQPDADVTIGPFVSDDTGEVSVSPDTVTFTSADWDIPQTITVTGVDDLVEDGYQTVIIDLGFSSSASSEWNSLDPGDVTVSNMDNELSSSPEVLILTGDGLITDETGIVDNFSVVLKNAPGADVVIPSITSSDTGEITVSPSSLTFTASDWDTPQAVTLTGIDDAAIDGTQAVTISFGTTSSTDPDWDSIAIINATAYNIDDEVPPAPGVIVSAGSSNLISEDNTSGSFEVVLMSQPTADVTIAVGVSDTSEGTITAPFIGTTGTLTFTSTTWSIVQTVTVQGVNDDEADGNRTFTVTLGATASSDTDYDGTFDPADVSFTNIDNDICGITVGTGDGLITDENGLADTFSVVLNSAPTADVNLTAIVSGDTGEVTVSPSSLTFTTSDWSIVQTVTVTGVDDALIDGEQSVTIDLGIASSTDTNYNSLDPGDVTVCNLDDESPAEIIVISDFPKVTSENGGTAVLKLVLNKQPEYDVTLSTISTLDNTEGIVDVPASGTLTFTSSDWNSPHLIVVIGQEDADSANTDYSIDLGTTSSSDPNWDGIDPGDVTLTNNNLVTVDTFTRNTGSGTFASIDSSGTSIQFFALNDSYYSYDEGVFVVSTGFPFYFLGKRYSQVFIFTNGFLSFNVNSEYYDYAWANELLFYVFGSDELTNIIAPWWDDFSVDTGNVYYLTEGSIGSRVFTVEWNNVYHTTYDDTYTFQVKLYESTNQIEFIYGDAIVYSDASTASIGLKDDATLDPSNYWLDGYDGATGNDSDYSADTTRSERPLAEFPGLDQVITFTLP